MVLNHGSNRRVSRRRSLDEIPELIAVKIHSQEVTVLNASRGGILVECGIRLPPGTVGQLELHNLDRWLRVRARVVRCQVTKISGDQLIYQVGFSFSQDVDFIADDELIPTQQFERPAAQAFKIWTPVGGVDVELESFAMNSW